MLNLISSLNQLRDEAHETAKSKGWHNKPIEFGTIIGLIHTEVTEAYRATSNTHYTEELADIIIRSFDAAGLYELDLNKALPKEKPFLTLEGPLSHTHLLEINARISSILETYRVEGEAFQSEAIATKFAELLQYIFSLSKTFDLDIENAITAKMKANKNRTYRHGGKSI